MVTNDRFLYCCGCNEVHRITPFDDAPIYDRQGSRVRAIPMNDRHRFMERHSGHAIEEMSRVAEDWLEPDNVGDPMAESYLLVANERYLFLLQRSRRSIAEPVVYRVMPRRIPLWPSAFDREAVIQWRRHLRAHWLHGKAQLRRSLVGSELDKAHASPGKSRRISVRNWRICRLATTVDGRRATRNKEISLPG